MTTIINVTPHAINLNDGQVFAPSGHIARVSARFIPGGSCPFGDISPGACNELSTSGSCKQECLQHVYLINSAVTCGCDECLHGGGCGHWIKSSHIPVFKQVFGEVQGLPDQQADTVYIVSAMVLDAAKASGRTDCVAPATGHPDVKRNDKGQLLSVPGFVS